MPRRRTASRSPSRGSAAERACPRETWRQLLSAVDATFPSCERYWHRGRYYVRHARTFAALVRDPGNESIEVRVAATGYDPAAAGDTLWGHHPESGAPPRLRTIRVRHAGDIRPALEAAKRAERRWGRRPRPRL